MLNSKRTPFKGYQSSEVTFSFVYINNQSLLLLKVEVKLHQWHSVVYVLKRYQLSVLS